MNGASTLLLFVRVGFSLAIVLGLIWLAARVAKRRGKIATRQGETTNIDVVARRQLGRRGSLVVVDSGGRRFLVGVTEHRIELVADLSADDHGLSVDARSQLAPERPQPIEVRPQPVAEHVTVLPAPVEPVELPLARPTASIERPPVVLDADEPTGPRRESLVDALRDLTVRR